MGKVLTARGQNQNLRYSHSHHFYPYSKGNIQAFYLHQTRLLEFLQAQKGLSKPSTIISDSTDTTRDKIGTPAAPVDVSTPTEKVNFIAENDGSASISTIQPYQEQKLTDSASPLLGTSLSNILAEDTGKHENNDAEVLAIDTDVEVATDFAPNSDAIPNYSDVKPESIVNRTNQEDHKTDISPKKVQDQLDEVCAGLSSRLQEYKSENAQLEELLIADFAERELSKPCEARIKQLQKDLSESKREVTRVESNLAEAVAAKNGEIEALLSSMEAVKRQTALSEGNLASMQASIESMMRNRELSETRMMQRIADERTSKATELEQKVALLEMQAWQEEVEHARQGQREAENKLSSLEAEMQKLRVEMAVMKRDAEHYSRQYYKQTQLETMVSEKAATEFQLEKEIKRLQEAQVCVHLFLMYLLHRLQVNILS
ncbi:hypothetical protein TanjilG_29735 [Lupinus angustifolius]|uniref:Golgin candidate 1 n=1 Tax=Lupinus angustifolius TaxID=3871 RepID=A0A1J7GTF5_LUPAN|nr:hypothetical protein TanjilG_29735 [Lupinus angustifolius]